ncbi:MAG: alpha/beta hydrolase fold domain-containing protein [Opitutae bacterium]|jgi:acetyl esterase/lipase|nr:alpha/beta hydrolase fold domain-containing protein [Opitutae bacterium]
MQTRLILLGLLAALNLHADSYQREDNLSYRSEAETAADAYVAERCVLDLSYPKNKDGFATIVWFHGGGLTEGNKYIPGEIASAGYAVVAPNYRFSPRVSGQTCVEDAAAAIAWVFENIAEYGGDPDKIFLSGHSAGGYLASMVGMDKSYLQAYDIDANQIAGLIPFSGHTITHFTIRKEIGGFPPHQALVDQMAPLYHVRADAPPLLLITGDRELELWGRYEENAYMMRMMRVAGHKDTRIMELDGYGHGMERPAFPLLLKEVKRVLGEE